MPESGLLHWKPRRIGQGCGLNSQGDGCLFLTSALHSPRGLLAAGSSCEGVSVTTEIPERLSD